MTPNSHCRSRNFLRAALVCATCCCALPGVSLADMLFAVTNDDNLVSVNTANPGGSTLIGALSTPASALGLFYQAGSLYLYDTNNNVIDKVNPANGTLLSTINIGLPVVPGEGDIAFYNGTGYLASTLDANGNFNGTTGTLYKFTLTANSAQVVTQSIPLLDGLAFSPNGTLYGLAQGGQTLDTIDPATGNVLATLNTGINDNCGGFACYGFGGLIFGASGNLFASLSNFSNPTSAFFELNTANGIATQLADIPFDQVSGLASLPPPPAPEPTTFSLCVLAVLAVIVVARHRRE